MLDPMGPEKNRLGPNKYNGAKGKNRLKLSFLSVFIPNLACVYRLRVTAIIPLILCS